MNTLDSWEARWTAGHIGFHRDAINPSLLAHHGRLACACAKPRVLVPLCGMSEDLAFLAQHAAPPVVGVEWVGQAIEAFYAARGWSAQREAREGEWWSHEHAEVTLHQGDFFAIAPKLGHFDAVYDRAALIAISPQRRREYLALLASLLVPRGKVLLLTTYYDQAAMEGPPFSLAPTDLPELAAEHFEAELLDDDDIFAPRGNFAERGLTWQRRASVLLTKKR